MCMHMHTPMQWCVEQYQSYPTTIDLQNVIYQTGQKKKIRENDIERVKAERIPLQIRRKNPFLQQSIVILIYKLPETFCCIVINSFRISESRTIVLVLSSK